MRATPSPLVGEGGRGRSPRSDEGFAPSRPHRLVSICQQFFPPFCPHPPPPPANCARPTEPGMRFHQTIAANAKQLNRLAALLVALAGLAERAAGRPSAVCLLVVWLIRPSEAVARDLVENLAPCAACPPEPLGRRLERGGRTAEFAYFTPPSALPGISPTRGGDRPSRRVSPIANVAGRAAAPKPPISPHVGEMSGRTEGGAEGWNAGNWPRPQALAAADTMARPRGGPAPSGAARPVSETNPAQQ